MSNNKEIPVPEFIRHFQFGPGRVIDKNAQGITVQFRKSNGELDDNTYNYELSGWKTKEIPEDSLGALFIKAPAKVFSLIDAHNPEIVELFLRESKGEAKQTEIRRLLEPLIRARGHEWNKWWKKVGQRLRGYKSVTFDNKEKAYKIIDTEIQGGAFSDLSVDSIGAYQIDQVADLSELVFDRRSEFKNIDKSLITALWDRLCQVINESPPNGREASALLALGELLSDVLSIQDSWISLIQKWLENHEVNLLGIRDSKIRAYALKSLSNLEWSKKRETLGFYILHEESGEKNRVAASRLLWSTCESDPNQYFDILTEASKKLKVPARSPSVFIPSRAERVINPTIEFIGSLKGHDMIEAFCSGSTRFLIAFFTREFRAPMESKPAQDIFGIWLRWKKKVENLLPKEDTWIIWANFPSLLRSCSEHAQQKFIEGLKDVDNWIESISNIIIEQANEGRIESADSLYNLLTLMIDISKAEQALKSALNSGEFLSKEAQDWALSHMVKHKSHYEPKTSQEIIIEKQFAEMAFHPREKRVATDLARLLLIFREREESLIEAISNFEELVRLYEPVRSESIQALKSFFDLIVNGLEELRGFLKLEYIGSVGDIEEYNISKHQLVDEAIRKPKYVEIFHSGIGRKRNNGLLDILQKAIVKPATGGSL